MGHRIKAVKTGLAGFHTLGLQWVILLSVTPLAQSATSAIAPATAEQALQLYRMSLTGGEKYSYAGREYITTWSDDGHSTMNVVTKVYHEAPDQYVLRFLAPKDRAGRVILENASYEWTYIPDRKVVIQTSRPTAMPEDNTSELLLANYSITMGAKPDIIANRRTYIVTLTSKIRHDKALRFWIDPYTGVALRAERYHAGGNLAYVSYFSDINYQPKFDAGLFTPFRWPKARIEQKFDKPTASGNMTDNEVVASLQGRALAPQRIREFSLVGVTSMQASSGQTLHLHYSDGLSSVSLFETLKRNRRATRMAGSRPMRINARLFGRFSERLNYSLLNWDSNQLSLTLLGDLSPETLRDLAGALTPPTDPSPAGKALSLRPPIHR